MTYITVCGSVEKTISVNSTVGEIDGVAFLCSGEITSLSDATGGGLWSTSTPGICTVNASGVVLGISPGLGSITYTASCGSPALLTITINAMPPAIVGLTSLCSGVTISLADSGSGAWASSDTSVAKVTGSGVVTGFDTGVVSISYSLPGGCSVDKIITVNGLSAAGFISGPGFICMGAIGTFIDTAGYGGGVWQSSDLSHATISTSGLVSPIALGIDTISFSVTNVCGTTVATKTISIQPLPTTSAISGASTICLASEVTFSDSAIGGSWSSSNTANVTISGTGVASGVGVGSDTIIYSFSNACGTASTSKIISVIGNPGVIAGLSHVCSGLTDSLFDASTTGVWSSSNTSFATISPTGVVSAIFAGIDTITYNTGCGSPASFVLTINPLANAGIISGLSSLCQGTSATLVDSGATGGIWSASNVSATISEGLLTGVNAGLDTIVYTVTNICNTAMATLFITINALPNAGVLTGPDSVCVSSSIDMFPTATGGVFSTTNGHAVADGTLLLGVTSGRDTVIYTVTSPFCGSASTTEAVLVLAGPETSVITGDSIVCVGAHIVMYDSANVGTWGISNSSAFIDTGLVTGIFVGVDTVVYTNTNYCGSTIAIKSITINALANAGVITGVDSVCSLQTVTLHDTVTGGIWTVGNPAIAAVSGGVVYGILSGLDSVYYTVSNICGYNTSMKVVFVKPLPVSGTITGDSAVCVGSSITDSDIVGSGIWTVSGGGASVSGGVILGVSAGIDTVKYSVSNSCGFSTSEKLIRVDTPLMPMIAGQVYFCLGNNDTLIGLPPGGIWTSLSTNDTISSIGILTSSIPGLDTIQYTVSNSCGSDIASAHIHLYTAWECDSVLSVKTEKRLSDELFNVYPNPTTGRIYLSFNLPTFGDCLVTITNIIGEKVKDFSVPSHSLIEAELVSSPGVYFITVFSGSQTLTKKVVLIN